MFQQREAQRHNSSEANGSGGGGDYLNGSSSHRLDLSTVEGYCGNGRGGNIEDNSHMLLSANSLIDAQTEYSDLGEAAMHAFEVDDDDDDDGYMVDQRQRCNNNNNNSKLCDDEPQQDEILAQHYGDHRHGRRPSSSMLLDHEDDDDGMEEEEITTLGQHTLHEVKKSNANAASNSPFLTTFPSAATAKLELCMESSAIDTRSGVAVLPPLPEQSTMVSSTTGIANSNNNDDTNERGSIIIADSGGGGSGGGRGSLVSAAARVTTRRGSSASTTGQYGRSGSISNGGGGQNAAAAAYHHNNGGGNGNNTATTTSLPPVVISPAEVDFISVQLEKNQQCACRDCGKLFNSVWYLKQHAVKHSNDRPFKCKFCLKTYKFRSNLYQHKCPDRSRHLGNGTLAGGGGAGGKSGFRKRFYTRGVAYTEFHRSGGGNGADITTADYSNNGHSGREVGNGGENALHQLEEGSEEKRGRLNFQASHHHPSSGIMERGGGGQQHPYHHNFTNGGGGEDYSESNEPNHHHDAGLTTADEFALCARGGLNGSGHLSHYGTSSATSFAYNGCGGSSMVSNCAYGATELGNSTLSYANASNNGTTLPLLLAQQPTLIPAAAAAAATSNSMVMAMSIRERPLSEAQIAAFLQRNRHRVYPCRKCRLHFPCREYLSRHMAWHSADDALAPHACDQCPQRFISNALLQQHFLQHASRADNNSPHRCLCCFGAFRSALALRRHKDQCRQCGSYVPPPLFGAFPYWASSHLMVSPSVPLDQFGFVGSDDDGDGDADRKEMETEALRNTSTMDSDKVDEMPSPPKKKTSNHSDSGRCSSNESSSYSAEAAEKERLARVVSFELEESAITTIPTTTTPSVASASETDSSGFRSRLASSVATLNCCPTSLNYTYETTTTIATTTSVLSSDCCSEGHPSPTSPSSSSDHQLLGGGGRSGSHLASSRIDSYAASSNGKSSSSTATSIMEEEEESEGEGELGAEEKNVRMGGHVETEVKQPPPPPPPPRRSLRSRGSGKKKKKFGTSSSLSSCTCSPPSAARRRDHSPDDDDDNDGGGGGAGSGSGGSGEKRPGKNGGNGCSGGATKNSSSRGNNNPQFSSSNPANTFSSYSASTSTSSGSSSSSSASSTSSSLSSGSSSPNGLVGTTTTSTITARNIRASTGSRSTNTMPRSGGSEGGGGGGGQRAMSTMKSFFGGRTALGGRGEQPQSSLGVLKQRLLFDLDLDPTERSSVNCRCDGDDYEGVHYCNGANGLMLLCLPIPYHRHVHCCPALPLQHHCNEQQQELLTLAKAELKTTTTTKTLLITLRCMALMVGVEMLAMEIIEMVVAGCRAFELMKTFLLAAVVMGKAMAADSQVLRICCC